MKSGKTSVLLNIYQSDPLISTACVHVALSPLFPSLSFPSGRHPSTLLFLAFRYQCRQVAHPSLLFHGNGKRERRTVLTSLAPRWLSCSAFAKIVSMRVQCTCVCYMVRIYVRTLIFHRTSTTQACNFCKCKIRVVNSLCPWSWLWKRR